MRKYKDKIARYEKRLNLAGPKADDGVPGAIHRLRGLLKTKPETDPEVQSAIAEMDRRIENNRIVRW